MRRRFLAAGPAIAAALGLLAGAAVVRCSDAFAAAADPMRLAAAIYRIPSTGRPSPRMAGWLAGLIVRECGGGAGWDGWTVAALMRAESGYRPRAVEAGGRGPGLGILQLHRSYLPRGLDAFHVPSAVAEGCAKLGRIERAHRRCTRAKPHDLLVHWFAGWHVEGNERAILSALRVRDFERELRRLGGVDG